MENGVTPSPLVLSIKLSQKRGGYNRFNRLRGISFKVTNKLFQNELPSLNEYQGFKDDVFHFKIRSHIKKNTLAGKDSSTHLNKIHQNIMENMEDPKINTKNWINDNRKMSCFVGGGPFNSQKLQNMQLEFDNQNALDQDDDDYFKDDDDDNEDENILPEKNKMEEDEDDEDKDLELLDVLKKNNKNSGEINYESK